MPKPASLTGCKFIQRGEHVMPQCNIGGPSAQANPRTLHFISDIWHRQRQLGIGNDDNIRPIVPFL